MLLQDGKLTQAEPALRRKVAKNPDSIADHTNLGILLARTGRAVEATKTLSQVLRKQPDYCPALVQQAELQLNQYDIDAAEQSYRTCLAAEPDHPTALLNLGILLELYRGRLDDARHQYGLYLQTANPPRQEVANWITDLDRRLVSAAKVKPMQHYAEVTP